MAVGILLCDVINGKKILIRMERNIYSMLVDNNLYKFRNEIKSLLEEKKEEDISKYIEHKTGLRLTHIKEYINFLKDG